MCTHMHGSVAHNIYWGKPEQPLINHSYKKNAVSIIYASLYVVICLHYVVCSCMHMLQLGKDHQCRMIAC